MIDTTKALPGLGGHWPNHPCHRCGWYTLYADFPAGEHAYGIRCAHCGQHIGWMQKSEVADFEEAVKTHRLRLLVCPMKLAFDRKELTQGALFS